MGAEQNIKRGCLWQPRFLFGRAPREAEKESSRFLKKAAQKLLLCWAEGLKVPAVRSTVGIAPEGMGVVSDTAHAPD
jgi:hypothetical protein